MATIELSKNHTLGRDAARAKAEAIAQDLAQKIGLGWSWAQDTIAFEAKSGVAKGLKGKLDVLPDLFRIEIDLPFMLRPLKGMVEGKVKEQLDAIG